MYCVNCCVFHEISRLFNIIPCLCPFSMYYCTACCIVFYNTVLCLIASVCVCVCVCVCVYQSEKDDNLNFTIMISSIISSI